MSEEYFDFVGINSDTIILYGRRADGEEFSRELNEAERKRIYRLTSKHDQERDALLRELAA